MLLCCMVGRCTHGSIARLPMLMLCMLSLFSVDELGMVVWPSEGCGCSFFLSCLRSFVVLVNKRKMCVCCLARHIAAGNRVLSIPMLEENKSSV